MSTLKVAILVVFAGLVLSLVSGLVFLLIDQGSTRRTLHSLGLRITLATLLMALVIYGVATGQLKSRAPWSAALEQSSQSTGTPPEQGGSDNVHEQE